MSEEIVMNSYDLYRFRRKYFPKTIKVLKPKATNSDVLVIEEGINEIPNFAFRNADIKKVIFPKSLRWIGANAFENCRNLEEVIFEDTSKLMMIDGSFQGCSALKRIEDKKLGNNTICLHYLACASFRDCKNLEEIRFKTLDCLSFNVFSGCSKLKEVSLPNTLTSILGLASSFINCNELKEVYLPNSISKWFLIETNLLNDVSCTFIIDKNCSNFIKQKLKESGIKYKEKNL